VQLARILEINRRNEEALALYRRVLEHDPKHAGALIATGLLYMREGDEEKARGYLETGFEGDRYNLRAYNQLQLLDSLDTYSRYATEHFEFRLQAASDSLLVDLLSERMEAIYEELVPRHEWRPERRTIVEVFPSHDLFSARVTGLPWIGGIPAVCFGHVIATDSPRTLAGRTNWEDVLRHEFGHVLALGMTEKKVPFWFTEGLSVFLEKYPRGLSWDLNLVSAYVDGDLVSVDSLTIAFTRPRSMNQRMLAYHESGLIVADLVRREGWDVVPELLREFGEGWDLAAAIPRATGESYDRFRERSHRAIREEAAELPVWPRPDRRRLGRLAEAAPDRETDPEFLRLYAITQYQLEEHEGAAETATRLQELEGENPFSPGILGLIDRAAKRPTARERLERAVSLGSRDLPVYAALARIELAGEDTAAAVDLQARSLRVYPHQTGLRAERAYLLARMGRLEEAKEEYRALLALSGSAGEAALELARLELESGRGEPAVRALDYATSILPLHADAEALRGQAYLLLDRDREAYDLFVRARQLDLRSVESMVGMAGYYLKQGDYEEALYFAELALKYDPDHARAREILARARAG
jgi:tetratricopeptide (TPR) repeat protein